MVAASLILVVCNCSRSEWLTAVRQPAFAGVSYPRDAKELDQLLSDALARTAEPAGSSVVAVLVPHDALPYTADVSAAAFRAASGGSYDRIVLLADADAQFQGVALPNVAAFGSPLGAVMVDRDAVQELARMPLFRIHLSAFDDNYQVENQIPWIRKMFPAARVVPVAVGQVLVAQRAAVAAALRSVLGGRTLLVCSSILSRSNSPPGLIPGSWNGQDIPAMAERSKQFDAKTMELLRLRQSARLREQLDRPGYGGAVLEIFSEAVPDPAIGHVAAYETSVTYEEREQMAIDDVVGYGALVFRMP